MAQCPKCGAEQIEDYGMVTCPGCKSILFIGMDGEAQVTDNSADNSTGHAAVEADEAAESVAGNEFAPLSDLNSFPHADPEDFPTFETPQAPEARETDSLAQESADNFSAFDAFEPLADDPTAPIVSASEPEFGQELSNELNDPPDFGPADDPLGLKEYAESEFSQAKDGLLLFRLLISGIDTKELRESIREAIEDSRFAWNSNKIMGSISKGVLKIENVSPVKAAILITRIKRLSLEIRWEQYAITQMQGFEDP